MAYPQAKLEQCGKNLYNYLCLNAEKSAGSDFIITEEGVLSYGKALEIVQSIATDYLKSGVKKGDLIAVRATRSADTALLILAICAVGAVAVACDAHFGVKEYIANSGGIYALAFMLLTKKKKAVYLQAAAGHLKIVKGR